MKHSIIHLIYLLVAISARPCLAGGTIDTVELMSLMQQQPTVHEALLSSLHLAGTAYAEIRLGPHFKFLGGTRVGPYTIKATLKQSRREVEVVLCTEARFLGGDGSELPQEKMEEAVRIDEKLSSVILREPSNSVPSCP